MNNGGPAFPMQFLGIDKGALSYEDTENQEGMSLRDYFATAALQGICAAGSFKHWSEAATDAYDAADAMLEARKNKS